MSRAQNDTETIQSYSLHDNAKYMEYSSPNLNLEFQGTRDIKEEQCALEREPFATRVSIFSILLFDTRKPNTSIATPWRRAF